MNSFDKNLKRLRNQRNLKQEDLAERINVTRQTISGWETGRRQPDLDTLKKLAEVLDVDVHELIYGNKPGAYPKFQRKYVICTKVFGGIMVILLLFRLLILPYLQIMINTFHWGPLLTICYDFLPQVGSFAFGSLFPGVIQLFMPVRMKKRSRLWCLVGGLTAILPVILFWLEVRPWSRWILSKIGNAMLTFILPAISGTSAMFGTLCQIAD